MSSEKSLFSIIELGGYLDFNPLYKRFGYEPVVVFCVREALGVSKKAKPQVVVAEFD